MRDSPKVTSRLLHTIKETSLNIETVHISAILERSEVSPRERLKSKKKKSNRDGSFITVVNIQVISFPKTMGTYTTKETPRPAPGVVLKEGNM